MSSNIKIERSDQGFAYFELFSGSHYQAKTKIWVHNSLVEGGWHEGLRKCKNCVYYKSYECPKDKGNPPYPTSPCDEFKACYDVGVEFITFPKKNAWIEKTKKGSLVMRPKENGTVYLVEISSGYRGWAEIKNIRTKNLKICETVASGERYHSPQGALGCTAWAVVNATDFIEVKAEATGRRVDNGEFTFRLTPDGEYEELIMDKEVCSLLEE